MMKNPHTFPRVPRFSRTQTTNLRNRQAGASLIMVLLILMVVSVLGVGGAQIALMSERSARNDRDQQIAWQAAEAAMLDAESDLYDPASTRNATFKNKLLTEFVVNCGTSTTGRGLCTLPVAGKPAWLTADFTDTSANANTVAFGTFTGKTFSAGGVGIQPALAPRYVIEVVPDQVGSKSESNFVYRITAIGFGPRQDIQAVLQMFYRI
jgi:type IV pilus assembly protein PilX